MNHYEMPDMRQAMNKVSIEPEGTGAEVDNDPVEDPNECTVTKLPTEVSVNALKTSTLSEV